MGRLSRTAFVNSKGGTGKSTTAVTLAVMAAEEGQRVLLVDCDKQGTATKWLGGSKESDATMEALIEQKPLDPLVAGTAVRGLELLPASGTFSQDYRLRDKIGFQFFLREALDQMAPRDWVVIDAPGDLGVFTILALTAATEVVIPITAGGGEIDVLPEVMDAISATRARLNPGLGIAGVVLTRVHRFGAHLSVLDRQMRERLVEDFFPASEVLEAAVEDDLRLGEAVSWKKPITEYAPDSRGTRDYRAVYAELVGRAVSSGQS